MTDHFDKWINGMSENEYEDWLEDDASQAQEDKALNIRTPISEQEEEDIEREQESREQEAIQRIKRTDIRMPVKPFHQQIEEFESEEIPERLRPVIVEPKPEPVILSRQQPIAIEPRIQRRISFTRVRMFITGILSRLRRNR